MNIMTTECVVEPADGVEAILHEVRSIRAQAHLLAMATNQFERIEKQDLRVTAWGIHLAAVKAERKLGEMLAKGHTP